MSDYDVSILLEIKQKGAEQAVLVNAALAGIKEQLGQVDESMKRAREQGDLHSQMLSRISLNTQRTGEETKRLADALESKLTPSLNNVNKAASSSGGGFQQFVNFLLPGGSTAVVVAEAITILAVALGPLTVELAASLVLLGAWAVGLAGFAGMVAVVAAPILAMAAAFGALGLAQMGGLDPHAQLTAAIQKQKTALNQSEAANESLRLAQIAVASSAHPTALQIERLKQAQEQAAESAQALAVANNNVATAQKNAAGPVSVFHEGLVAIGKELGQKAVPLVNQFATLLVAFLPAIDQAGNAIFKWFGDAFPLLMDIAQKAIFGLIGGLNQIAAAWVKVANDFLTHPVEFEKIFGTFFNLGIQAVIGLMQNLDALAFWFIDRFPVLEKNAESTFGNLGTAIQMVARGLGTFVDWVIAAWPTINRIFDASWSAFMDGWNLVKPAIATAYDIFRQLGPIFQFIAQHADNLKVVFGALALVIGSLLIILATLIVIVILVAAAIVAIGMAIRALVDYTRDHAGPQFAALGAGVQAMGKDFGAAFSAIGTWLHGFGINLQHEVQSGGEQFAALIQAAQTAAKDIGSAWDAIGTKVHEIATKNSIIIATSNDEQSRKIADSNKLNQSVIGSIWDAISSFLGNTWNALWRGASFWWNSIFNSVAFWLNEQWKEVVRQWNAITSWLGNTWNALWQTAGFWWGAIHNSITGWMSTTRDTVQNIWNGMVGAAGSAMSQLGSKIHEGILAAAHVLENFIQAVDSALFPVLKKDPIPHINFSQLAEGGVIPGYAPGQDTVPALLSPGEAVLTPQAVRQMGGAPVINAINRSSGVAHFAAGGFIPPLDGQCVPYVENALGIYWPVALAKQLASYVNSQTAKAGEAAVFTGGAAGHVALVTGPGDGFSFPVTDSNWVAPLTIGSHIMNKSMYGFSGFIDTGHGAVAGLPGVATAVVDLLGPIIDGLLNTAKGQISGVPDWIRGLPGPLLDELAGAVKNQFANLYNAAMNPFAGIAGVAGGAVNLAGGLGSWIAQAIAATGVPSWWAPLLAVLVGRESGGNPNAINRTDSNALAGHPSQGLAQVIPGTFAAYHQPGTSGNILDPVANLAAAINYIKARYGSILSVQQANASLPPRGYDGGGNLPTGLSYVWNGTGRTEPVLGPNAQDDIAGMRGLLREVLTELRILNGRQRSGALTATAQMG